MERKLMPVLLLMQLLFWQCSKNNKENKAPDLNKGLFAWFRLDNDFIDYAGNSSEPMHVGTITAAYDRKGNADNAMFFEQGLLYFKTNDILAEQISVSFWFKPESLQNHNFITTSKEYAFGIQQYNNKIIWQIYNGSEEPNLTGIIKLGWTHIVGTADGKEMKLYLNGKLVDTEPHPGNTYATKLVYVGNWNGVFLPCTLDDLRYYNRALTEEEIALLANQ